MSAASSTTSSLPCKADTRYSQELYSFALYASKKSLRLEKIFYLVHPGFGARIVLRRIALVDFFELCK